MRDKILVLAFDGLDPDWVEKTKCKNLIQAEHGTTDISGYKIHHSMLIWPELLTGKNMEKDLIGSLYEFKPNIPLLKHLRMRVPVRIGKMLNRKIWREEKTRRMLAKLSPLRQIIDEMIWTVKLPVEQTLFRHFEKYKAIDVPLFNHNFERHKKERFILGTYYGDIHNRRTLHDLESTVLENYHKNREELLNSIDKDYEIIYFFTSFLDIWGHVHIARPIKMMRAYYKVNNLVGEIKDHVMFTIIVSDHGMVQVSKYFGDHRDEGFWSSSKPLGLKKPRLRQLYQVLVERAIRKSSL